MVSIVPIRNEYHGLEQSSQNNIGNRVNKFYQLLNEHIQIGMPKTNAQVHNEIVTLVYNLIKLLPDNFNNIQNNNLLIYTNPEQDYQIRLVDNCISLHLAQKDGLFITNVQNKLFNPDGIKLFKVNQDNDLLRFKDINLRLLEQEPLYSSLKQLDDIRFTVSAINPLSDQYIGASKLLSRLDQNSKRMFFKVFTPVLEGLNKSNDNIMQSKILYSDKLAGFSIVKHNGRLCLYKLKQHENKWVIDHESLQVLMNLKQLDAPALKEQFHILQNDPVYNEVLQDINALKIQRTAKNFQRNLANKPVNEKNYKLMTYDNHGEQKKFLFSENLVGHSVPEENIYDSKERGAFKQLAGVDQNSVYLKGTENNQDIAFTPNEIEKILIENKINSFVVTHQFEAGEFLAHKAGTISVAQYIKQSHQPKLVRLARLGMESVPISKKIDVELDLTHFSSVLSDLRKLHQAGYYHLDIKPGNMMVNSRGVIKIIDLDTFSSVEQLVPYAGTSIYLDCKLCDINFNYEFPEYGPTDLSLRISDEYAMALSLMETVGCDIPFDNLQVERNRHGKIINYVGRDGDLAPTSEMIKFINRYVKLQYRPQFTQLITNPYEYYNNKDNDFPYLADMLRLS